MAGIIYRLNVPTFHTNLILRGFSSFSTAELQYAILDTDKEANETLVISVEETWSGGRRIMAERLMLVPFFSHWHKLRFGDITQSERAHLRKIMLEVRSGIALGVR